MVESLKALIDSPRIRLYSQPIQKTGTARSLVMQKSVIITSRNGAQRIEGRNGLMRLRRE